MMDKQINRTEKSKLYKVLKVKNKDCYTKKYAKQIESEQSEVAMHFIDVNISDKFKLKKLYTLVKESDVIRIIRCLELDRNNELDYGFIAIEDIISLDVSTKIYKENKLGIIYLRKVEKSNNGDLNVISVTKYKRLLASTGGIRSNKVIFVREELFDKANDILLCGMPNDVEFEFFSKYSAYYALAATDSTPVTMPRIAVVSDYKRDITETFDVVTEKVIKGEDRISPKTGKVMIDKKTGEAKKEKDRLRYDVETIEEYTEKDIKPFDGAGLIDINLALRWVKDLGIDYIPSSFQFRAIPGIKGNLYTVDLQEFAEGYPNKKTIKDAWGNNIDLYDKDGNFLIDAILTVSQFKFFKQYKSFNTWLNCFDEETHGYKRTFNIAHVGEKLEDLKDKTLLSYQPLQSLKLGKKQIKILCEDTVNTITDISKSVDSFLKYRGFSEDDSQIPVYYKAMAVNKELFYDPWMQKKIQADIQGFKEKTYRGSLFVQANYQTLMPDIYGLALHSFGEEPIGLLQKDEVYSNYWFQKGIFEIDVIRFPHIAMEHGIANIVTPNKDVKMNFYKYITTGIITSMYSTLPLKANSADFDGDKILTNCSRVLISAVKDQMAHTITFVSDKPKAPEKTLHKINEMEKLIATDILGMSNNIGNVVNKISILWSMPQSQLRDKYIKIMSIIGSLTIDYVKTGEKTPIPQEILKFTKDEKLPEFMRTRYKNKAKSEKKNNKNRESLGVESIELFNQNICTMNEICKHMHSQIDNIELEKKEPNFDFIKSMINHEVNKYNDTYPLILKKLIEMKLESDDIARSRVVDDNGDCDKDKNTERDYMYKMFYEYCRIELLSLCTSANKMDKNKLIDYLIYAFFCDKDFALENQDKAILWNCFGKELTTRCKGKSRKADLYSDEKIKKLTEKANALLIIKEKQKKKKSAKNKANAKITMLQGDREVKIYQSELEQIKTTVVEPQAVKLAIGLLVLDRFCKEYDKEFHIYISKRNTINQNQLVILTGIDVRNYEDLRNVLINKEIIKIEPIAENDYSILKCTMEVNKPKGKYILLRDINEVVKIFKNINNLNKIFNNVA